MARYQANVGDFVSYMQEEWRDIEGYEGLYQVSDLGRVRSLRHKTTMILRQTAKSRGYKYVQLQVNGVYWTIGVHRLVAVAFIPNPENKPQVDHIDGNPSNNSITNLRWATQTENMNNPVTQTRIREATLGAKNPFYGKSHTENTKQILSKLVSKRTGAKNPFYGRKHSDEARRKMSEYRKTTGIKVSQYAKDGTHIKDWQSASVAGRDLNINPSSISGCCKGKRKTIGGYIWRYTEY